MNKKIPIALLGLIIFAATIGIAKAPIKVTIIKIEDSMGNSIAGKTVPMGTVAYVYGYYEDLSGNLPATGLIEVYFYEGSTWVFRQKLFENVVANGTTTKSAPYTMTEVGDYRFTWACTKIVTDEKECVSEVAMALATVHHVPEPATLAALTMALSALGLLALKRIRLRKET